MKKKSRLFFLVVSKFSLCAILVLLILGAYFTYSLSSSEGKLYQKFFGRKAEYTGIITLWNVDTFEGGSASRANFLNYTASKFEKKFKGALIKVENLTIDEMMANIKAGTLPNMFCFGTGVSGYLKDKMIALPSSLEKLLLPNFYGAGVSDGKLLACPYAVGGYAILSSSERLEKAEKTGNLRDICLDLAFDKQLKKSSIHTYSMLFGSGDYISPANAFLRAFKNQNLSSLVKNKVIGDYLNMSTYQAYQEYVSLKASCLFGTQRDIFRLENRVSVGKELDLLCEPIGEYTDLVNYISVLSSKKEIENVCKDFVLFLLGDMQKELGKIGFISPTGQKLYDGGAMKLLENAINENTLVEKGI